MPSDHHARADALRSRVEAAGGQTDAGLRRKILARAAGGPAVPAPYEALVAQVVDASNRTTDAEVAAVRAAAGSDRAAFEIVMTAAVGAGLWRFDRAMQCLAEATDAPR